jgi:hypothetical protein
MVRETEMVRERYTKENGDIEINNVNYNKIIYS